MTSPMRFFEGTALQYEQAKIAAALSPYSLYLVEGRPYLALSETTAFAFVDTALVSQMIAGLSPGGDGGAELGNQARKSPTTLGSVGTSNLAAREDHTHPAQTSISGNANTATTAESARKLTNPQTIRLTGAISEHLSRCFECYLCRTGKRRIQGPVSQKLGCRGGGQRLCRHSLQRVYLVACRTRNRAHDAQGASLIRSNETLPIE